MSREKLEIRKGGKLVETKWVYDRAKGEGEYVDKDVTDSALRRFFDLCELEEGVTLKDIFLLMNTELDVFDAVIGNWCKEIVTEGLTQPEKPYDLTDEEAIEFLELYWHVSYDDGSQFGPSFYGYHRADFHGIGIARTKDAYHDWVNADGSKDIMYKKGERTPWGISFTPANELINIPVILAKEFNVFNENTDAPIEKYNEIVATFKNPTFSLGHILHGIIWELSFHGGPDKRDDMKKEVFDIVDDIKTGKRQVVTREK